MIWVDSNQWCKPVSAASQLSILRLLMAWPDFLETSESRPKAEAVGLQPLTRMPDHLVIHS